MSRSYVCKCKKGLPNLNHSTCVWDAIHAHAQVIVLQRKRYSFSKLLVEGRCQELLSKYVINLFTSVQSRYADAIEDISVTTRINKFSTFGTVNFQLGSCYSTVLRSLRRGRLASGKCLEAPHVSVRRDYLIWIIRNVCRMQFVHTLDQG